MTEETATDFNFFQPSADEIKDAQSGGRLEFKHNEEYTFLINGVKEQDGDKGQVLIVEAQVVGGDLDQGKHSFWFRNTKPGKKQWINMLRALFSDEEIQSGSVTPSSIMSKSVKSVAKESLYKDKVYYDFWNFAEAGGVPDMGSATVSTDDIPF